MFYVILVMMNASMVYDFLLKVKGTAVYAFLACADVSE